MEETVERLQTFEEYFKSVHPDYNWGITTGFDTAEAMFDAFTDQSKCGADGYKRGGYYAQLEYARIFMQEFDIDHLGFRAQILNSGMSAIFATVAALVKTERIKPDSKVILGEKIYSHSPEVYEMYPRIISEVIRVDSGNHDSIIATLEEHGDEVDVVHIETVGNGFGMPVLNVEALLSALWDRDISVIIDGTFTTLALSDDNIFSVYEKLLKSNGLPKMNFIYIESMTKYYRPTDVDEFSAGIVIGQKEFMDAVDSIMAIIGTYIQPLCLKRMPASPRDAVSRVIGEVSQKALAIAGLLRIAPWINEVSYPNLPAGGVIYFCLVDTSKEALRKFSKICKIKNEGSFGHSKTTMIPWGVFREDMPGIIRLSVGVDESATEIMAKLNKAATVVFGE